MLAMQYSIPLPHTMDAAKIRERVERRKPLFDNHKGLLHKSFVYSAEDHVYAPFYVWKDVSEAQHFLLDELYQGVIESFGRHRVRQWLVIGYAVGNKKAQATHALREIDPVAPERLSLFSEREKQHQAEMIAKHKELCLHVTALDADRWEVMRFSLWNCPIKEAKFKAKSDCLQHYEVLHVSKN
jgi:hypothetical protein